MFKLTAIVSLMLIATWSQADSRRTKKEATASSSDFDPGNSLWAEGLSCDSCGSECASACGTRHFRSCCFNYLRRKRAPEVGLKFFQPPLEKEGSIHALPPARVPLVAVQNVPDLPDSWLTKVNPAPNYKPNAPPRLYEDPLNNRVLVFYD